MIAKLIVHGDDRDDAVARLRHALSECRIAGLPTNLSLLKQVAASAGFANAKIDTTFIDSLDDRIGDDEELGLAVACLFVLLEQTSDQPANAQNANSPWHTLSGWRLNATGEDVVTFYLRDRECRVPIRYEEDGFTLSLSSGNTTAWGQLARDGQLTAIIGSRRYCADVVRDGSNLDVFVAGHHLRLGCEDRDHRGNASENISGLLVAPMPGRVISVLVECGAEVAKGQALTVIEAMKMEHTIRACAEGVVTGIFYGEGDLVEEGVELLAIGPSEDV